MLKTSVSLVGFLVLTTLAGSVRAADAPDRFLPAETLNLKLTAPIDTWDEAIPLGNGLLGGLLWGHDNTIRLSLDRGDLWDLRVHPEFKKADCTWKTLQRLVAEKKTGEIGQRFDVPYGGSWPTKLPGGRLELSLDPSQKVTSFALDLAHAVGQAKLSDGSQLESFFSAAEPVALMRIPGPPLKDWKLMAPGTAKAASDADRQSFATVKDLGYPPAAVGSDGEVKWFEQQAAEGFRYAAVAATRRIGNETLLALTITTNGDGADPVGLGRKRVAAALDAGYAKLLAPHQAWWRDFWHKSRIELPELNHLRHYYLVQYFYGAASRLGAPPIPLQGVWTADDGGLPPWKGDYHHDLNTQTTYIAYQTAGRFDEGRSFLEFMWNLLPEFRRFARKFYETPGAAVPGVMSLDGKPLGGWAMYSLSPTNAGWIGFIFYQHWRYTMDQEFLRDRAYPWCAEIGLCLKSLMKPDAQGILRLPLSSSPEIHNGGLHALLAPNSNYDHDCMAALFGGLAEMADALGKPAEAAQWRATLTALGPRAVNPKTHCLMLAPGEDFAETHRHLSHVISVYPFGLLSIEGTDLDRATIAATGKQYDGLGTGAWCGYSFTWMAGWRARAGQPEAAIQYLDIYDRAFILRNGFHVNGDQLKNGYSSFTYRPFTLEGNFLASQAVHEMLLQSWGGVIRVFPAVPARWNNAAFEDLRAEGGYRVSARRAGGAITGLKVTAGQDGVVKIRDNFGGRTPKWNRSDVEKHGNDWQVRLKAEESVEAQL
jgi:alpha-L-fucosidase 2